MSGAQLSGGSTVGAQLSELNCRKLNCRVTRLVRRIEFLQSRSMGVETLTKLFLRRESYELSYKMVEHLGKLKFEYIKNAVRSFFCLSSNKARLDKTGLFFRN